MRSTFSSHGKSCGCVQLIILLSPWESLHIVGSVRVLVLAGSCTIFGAKLSSGVGAGSSGSVGSVIDGIFHDIHAVPPYGPMGIEAGKLQPILALVFACTTLHLLRCCTVPWAPTLRRVILSVLHDLHDLMLYDVLRQLAEQPPPPLSIAPLFDSMASAPRRASPSLPNDGCLMSCRAKWPPLATPL